MRLCKSGLDDYQRVTKTTQLSKLCCNKHGKVLQLDVYKKLLIYFQTNCFGVFKIPAENNFLAGT